MERLINELIEHNKHFSMMAYPNRTHLLNEDGAERHYYELLTRYLRQNMPPGPKSRGIAKPQAVVLLIQSPLSLWERGPVIGLAR